LSTEGLVELPKSDPATITDEDEKVLDKVVEQALALQQNEILLYADYHLTNLLIKKMNDKGFGVGTPIPDPVRDHRDMFGPTMHVYCMVFRKVE
jgi:hypothetical protein